MSVENLIREKLAENFRPDHIEVINESHMHSVPENSETHFRVVIVSSHFDDLSLIQRHRKVNECLANELKSGVHALAIVAKTPSQWQKSPDSGTSPQCTGSKKPI